MSPAKIAVSRIYKQIFMTFAVKTPLDNSDVDFV